MTALKDRLVASNMIKYRLEFDEETKILKTYEFETKLVENFNSASSDVSQPDIERLVKF